MRTSTRVVHSAVFVMLGIWGRASVAQEELPAPLINAPRPTVTLEAPMAPVVEQDSLQKLNDRQRQLQTLRNELTSKFMAADQTVTNEGSSRRRTPKDIELLRENLDDRRQLEVSRTLRLQEKLRRLRDVIDQNHLCDPKLNPESEKPEPVATDVPLEAADRPADAAETANTITQDVAVEPKSDRSTSTETSVDPGDANRDAIVLDEQPANAIPDEHSTGTHSSALSGSVQESPSDVTDAMVQALALVDGPVDRLGLANNLYATGELQLALEVYQKIDRSSLEMNQQLWVEYQVANCYRKIGNDAEAERGYRIVTARDSKTWISENARWWLQIGSQRREVRASMNDLQRSLDDIKEAMRVSTNP